MLKQNCASQHNRKNKQHWAKSATGKLLTDPRKRKCCFLSLSHKDNMAKSEADKNIRCYLWCAVMKSTILTRYTADLWQTIPYLKIFHGRGCRNVARSDASASKTPSTIGRLNFRRPYNHSCRYHSYWYWYFNVVTPLLRKRRACGVAKLRPLLPGKLGSASGLISWLYIPTKDVINVEQG